MDLKSLSSNLDTFLTEARKRPETAGLSTTSIASVPQLYANVDGEKVIKQGAECTQEFKALLDNPSEAWQSGWGDEQFRTCADAREGSHEN
jgi:hypothetical protein